MGEEHIWRSVSMEGKWKDGKGDVAVRRVDYYGKTWVDLRIMNVEDGKNQHTRHGVRLTVEQVKELELVLHELLKCPAFQAPSLTIFRFFRSYNRPFLHEIPSHCQNLFVVALAAPSAFWTVQIFSKTPPDLDLPIADIHQKLIEAQLVVVEAELFAGDQLLVVAGKG